MNYGNLVIESQHQICHFARFVIHCAAYGTESLFSLVFPINVSILKSKPLDISNDGDKDLLMVKVKRVNV